MADRVERIVLEVDEAGAVTSISSANREVAKLEASFARSGQTMEQRLLAKIATLKGQMANDPARLNELNALQEKVLGRMSQNMDGLGAKIKNAIQNPMQAAGSAIGDVVTKLGPLGSVLAAGGAGFGLLAKQAFDFVRSQGEAAKEVENFSIRTGMSTKETMQFQAASKVVGVDVGGLARSMRLLSQAMSENSDEGQKGKRALKDMGVDAYDANQQLKPTGQLIREIAERIAAMPDVGAKTRALTALLGRGGSEYLPLFERLPELLSKVGDAWDENLNKHLTEFDEKVNLLEIRWGQFKKSLSEKILIAIETTGVLDDEKQFSEKQRRARAMMGADAGSASEAVFYSEGSNAPAAFGLAGEAARLFSQQAAARTPEAIAAERKRAAEEWDRYIQSSGTREEQIKRQLTAAEKDLKAAEEARDIAAHRAAESAIAVLEAEKKLIQENQKLTKELEKFSPTMGRDTESAVFMSNMEASQKAMEILRVQRLPQNLPTGDKDVQKGLELSGEWQAKQLQEGLKQQDELLTKAIEQDKERIKTSDEYWRQLQQQRFDQIKRGFEGLFDAALSGARSFWDALKRMAFTIFLTPVKEALGNMFAGMLTGSVDPRSQRLGAPGGGGGWGGIFGGLGAAASGYGDSGGGAGLPGFMPGMQGSTGGSSGGFGGVFGNLAGMKNMFWNSGSISMGSSGSTTAAGMGGVGGDLAGFATSSGGLMAGGMLATMGLMRGGKLGLGMSTGGGALVGAALGTMLFPGIGTAMGALIGAGIGAGAGLIRMLFKSSTDKAREKIKSLYGVDIQTKDILEKIVTLAKQGYGGNLDMAIRTQEVRDLIQLYAMSTGQNMGGPAQMTGGYLVQSGGSLYQPTKSSIDRIPGSAPASVGGGTTIIPLQIDSKPVGQVIIQNGRVVAQGALNAAKGNYGRLEMLALQTAPNAVLA